jgi:MFS family permease
LHEFLTTELDKHIEHDLTHPLQESLSNGPPPGTAPDDEAIPVQRLDARKVISFSSTDPDNPYNWPKRRKLFVFITGILTVLNSTVSSSIPSGAINFITEDFGVTQTIQQPLPISCFLAGYVVGPTVCGPLSEHNGRQRVTLSFFVVATIFSMACAVAPNWPSLLFFRFVAGVGFSGPIAITSGMYADIYDDPRQRGLSMAWFMVATTFGPVSSPALSGFIAENVTWRWVFALSTLMAVATIPFIVFMPETYAPVLLSRKAARLRKETGDESIVARSELHKKNLRYVLTVVMTRPYRMLFQELIVMCVCAYVSLVYAVFYLYFEAYPIIFQGPDSVYKWSSGLAGLAFLPIGLGSIFAAPIYIWWDSYLSKAQKRNAKWAQQEEYRRLPLACLGGPLYVVSLFWIGWSANPDTHWLAPVASGLVSGAGFLLIFMALLNYLTDAYETFAASAQGMASTARSVFGVLVPLAAHRMFRTLGIAWACSVLGFLTMGMCIIPFAFIKYGDRIRENSRFCQELKEIKARDRAEEEEEKERTAQRTVPAATCERRSSTARAKEDEAMYTV